MFLIPFAWGLNSWGEQSQCRQRLIKLDLVFWYQNYLFILTENQLLAHRPIWGWRKSKCILWFMFFLVLVWNWKCWRNRNFCILVPKILSILGSSQFRFQYQSFRFHLIWSRNGTIMEPNQYWNKTNANNPWKPCTETLVWEVRTRTEPPVSLNRKNRGLSTKTGTELRNQYRTNTSFSELYGNISGLSYLGSTFLVHF